VAGVVDDGGPITIGLDAPLEVARFAPFFQWILAIPHLIILSVLGSVVSVFVFIAFVTIVFTGRIPDGVFSFIVMYMRYSWRVVSYAIGLHDTYPPFEFEMEALDDGHSPASLDIEQPDELSRGLVWFKWLLVIPNAIVLFFVLIGASVAWFLGAISVLLTGRWPAGTRDFLVGVARWTNRLTAYEYLLTDTYPPYTTR
jgi:hypothetical protein